MARTARCFKHICAACAIISRISFSVVLSCRLYIFHAISPTLFYFPPFSAFSLLIHSRSFSAIIYIFLSFSLSLFISVSPLSHTRLPPTGEHSPCQTRIDLTLSVADYKSDQLGARCACRIRIGERSTGANVGA